MSGAGMRRLAGRRAIVTGAGSGIGRAIATRYVAEGARVVVADIAEDAAAEVAAELGASAVARRVDVTSAAEVRAAVEWAVATWGGLDVMVNNAGVGVAATTPETTEEDWQRVVDVCLKGTFLGMKYAIPAIRDAGGGAIVNMASVAALVGVPDRAAYCAAKGGVMALTRAAAVDHVAEGVRINCIAPGTVDTPWVRRITADYPDPEAARAAMRARQPHGRLVAPEEIAAMAAYLASDEAGSVIGAVMIVDGGMTAR
ncbi:MAG TPA: glucose 1-dehydrogenase, partial [Thermomicrobiales bacterium]|nr:glucose 1-dehydrogenase [Thermomicrobiales bacterium]